MRSIYSDKNLTLLRVSVLYIPITLALIAGFARKRRRHQFAACLLSFLWTLPALLIVQRINLCFHCIWWTFAPSHAAILGIPLEVFFGWAIYWGLVPQLAFHRLDPPEITILFGVLDLYLMLFLDPLVDINRINFRWIGGEVVCLLLILLPALYIARWTMNQTVLNLRATFQVILSGLLFLFLFPEIVFALKPKTSWQPLFAPPFTHTLFFIELLLLVAVLGISAMQEFAQRGHGTPIPYDPPQRLVTSGVYRYIANPMQLSCLIVMLGWAALLHNIWLVLAALMSAIYSAGIAAWDEHHDLAQRLGPAWLLYRRSVQNWRPRWHPYITDAPARVYMSRTCGKCSATRRWLEARSPIGLLFVDAETLPAGSIHRMTYDPCDGTPRVDGIRAMARTLEHINLAYAYCGFTMRLPLVWQLIQLLGDITGFGPRTVPADDTSCELR